MGNGTFVGLDVHARSVVAGLIDEDTGEVRVTRAPHAPTSSWAGWSALAGPVRVAYEAGPTGYRPGPRAARRPGIACLVAAPEPDPARAAASGSRTIAATPSAWRACCGRASWSRCAVPDPADEGARDLVRAREDARADLMRARHRLSKMLLRHGRVYEQGRAWTARPRCLCCAASAWLQPAARAAFVDYYDAALQAALRRDRLDRRDRASSPARRAWPRWWGACRACAG